MERILFLGTASILALSAAAQNTCATALPISAGLHTIVVVDGTQIPIPICTLTGTGATAGEWYAYTPTADHWLTITTDLAQNVTDDTRFHVYVGTCGLLSCISGDDDSGAGNLSTASFNVQQGITYIIAFDNRWSSSGFDFQLTEAPPLVQAVSFSLQGIATNGSPMCVVDMNNDLLDDVVAVTTTNININQQQQGGGWVSTNITTSPADHMADWSIAAGDYDNNGYKDLLYGGWDGVTFMKANATGTAFTEVSFTEYVFSQRTNFVDMNNDGSLEGFVCHDIDANVYFMNDGAGNLTFNQGGLGEVGGNYGSIWVDPDNDHDMDLFIAKCGSDPVDQLHRNNGDGTFTPIGAAMNLNDAGQSWSAAWGDYDNDGDMDVMTGAGANIGDGNKLMRNDGNTFVDVTAGSGFDLFYETGIEYTTHDFNNDGFLDVLCPNSTVMVNNGDMTFTPNVVGVTEGPVGDLNNDGYLDVISIWQGAISMNTGGTNHYLRINTVGTQSNRNGIGARVECTSALGTQIRDVKSGDGFAYMSSLLTHFGLGADTQVDAVTVYWPSGIINTVYNPAIDGVLTVVEDDFTGLGEIAANGVLRISPQPATDFLVLRADADLLNGAVTIRDIAGKEVVSTTLSADRLDVSGLAQGLYTLRVDVDGRRFVSSFTKQ
ncbi:MAG: FG-GAP-like repeat-containing protein [Flavobacteriales bacterium]